MVTVVAAARAGVLALQGAFAPHLAALRALGVPAREVRTPEDLDGLTHLVLPGGESTAHDRLLRLFGLREPILARWREGRLRLFGTCAGAILLGRDEGAPPPRFGILDAAFDRNAYGRQIDSFTTAVELPDVDGGAFPGVFIRAPKVRAVGPSCEVLAVHGGDPVLLRGPDILAATFHPELTADLRIHRLFLESPGAGP